jgi:hypothetical protein
MFHVKKDLLNAEKWFVESVEFLQMVDGEFSQNVVNAYHTLGRFLETEKMFDRAYEILVDHKDLQFKLLEQTNKQERIVEDLVDLLLFCARHKTYPQDPFKIMGEVLVICDEFYRKDAFTISKVLYSIVVYMHVLNTIHENEHPFPIPKLKQMGLEYVCKLLKIWNKRKESTNDQNPIVLFWGNAKLLTNTICVAYDEPDKDKQLDVSVIVNVIATKIEKIKCIL